ncbi:MAG: STAS domain-containing protein [Planctomycetes bacterium]|nr:STAS domain-containing protein [Planctomycetota bacterium]
MPNTVPSDFNAIVITPPARVDSSTIPAIQVVSKRHKLADFVGHRILHMHQVETIDSAAVAGLIDLIGRADKAKRLVLICDPPPIVRSYLDVYGAAHLLEGRVLSSANDGTYTTELASFVPPFVPNPKGRFDIYRNGNAKSFELGAHGTKEIAPVDLSSFPPKAPTRANRMAVHDGDADAEIKASGYVHVRKHNCGCDHTHVTFDKLHQLQAWFRNKGFDFQGLELWASDVPAGMVTEKMTFRDRMHFEQFQTLLKIDSGWKKIEAPMDDLEEEFYWKY